MAKKDEQANLIRKLGAFLAPVEDLANRPDDFDAAARMKVLARIAGDRTAFGNQVASFMQESPGRPYSNHQNRFLNTLKEVVIEVQRDGITPEEIRRLLDESVPIMQQALMEIPTDDVSGVLMADSPFTAYCRIQDMCRATFSTLIWTDRYFDKTIFHRYLSEVRPGASITLVTLDAAKVTQPKDKARHNEFMDISRLFAAERGPARYRLVSHPDFHDRWLRCDGQLYALGGSVKDAGVKSDFAIGRIDPTMENMKKVDDLVAAGNELFGPANTTHP